MPAGALVDAGGAPLDSNLRVKYCPKCQSVNTVSFFYLFWYNSNDLFFNVKIFSSLQVKACRFLFKASYFKNITKAMLHLTGIQSQFLHLWELPTPSVLHAAQSVLGHRVSFHSIPQLQPHSAENHTSAASNSNKGKIQQTAGWKGKSDF